MSMGLKITRYKSLRRGSVFETILITFPANYVFADRGQTDTEIREELKAHFIEEIETAIIKHEEIPNGF
jgi:hypothetical protein